MRQIVPLADLNHRLRVAGRIRLGRKTKSRQGKDIPTSIDRFRFTSPDRAALEQIAALYGGTVKPWSEPKAAPNQFEVYSEANEIPIVLPPDPLGESAYELWGRTGRERLCDGIMCTIRTASPDGPEDSDVPCLCVEHGARACQLKMRLSVILPEVRFTGVWRLDTSSENAWAEIPQFVDLIRSLQERKLTRAVLRLEQRRTQTMDRFGEPLVQHYVVPALGLADSIEVLAAGQATVGALGSGTGGAPHIGGSVGPPVPDDVVDAEIVEELGPVCRSCHLPLAGSPVVPVDGGYAHQRCHEEREF